MFKPVQWQATMNYLARFGVTHTIEMGAKNILSKLMKENIPSIESFCYGQKEDRKEISDFFLSKSELTKHIPTVITKCLAAAVATPNSNWDDDEYNNGVIEPYKKIESIQEELDKNNLLPNKEQMEDALKLLKTIFNTKKVDVEEQREWFQEIVDETGTNYLFKDLEIDFKKVV
jgi:[acyl-carrier-protein] S-malonyltransferase